MWKPTEYFGRKDKMEPGQMQKRIKNNLEFDDEGINRIAERVCVGIDKNNKGFITKEDFRSWTKFIL